MYPELFTIPGTNWPIKSYGFMLMIGFLTGVWLAMRRAERVKANPDLVLNVSFVALIAGVVGARVFYVIHYWKPQFAWRESPYLAALDLTAGGMEVYGGLLAGAAGIVAYVWKKRESLRLYLDILAPSAMWGVGIGRIGCFLNGCCWGAVCVDAHHEKALPWAMRFPFGSNAYIQQWEDRQLTAPAELIQSLAFGSAPISSEHVHAVEQRVYGPIREYEELRDQYNQAKKADPDGARTASLERRVRAAQDAARRHRDDYGDLFGAMEFSSREDPSRPISRSELEDLATANPSLPVHPTQLYASTNGLLLSLLLSSVFYRRQRHGTVIGLMFVLYGFARLFEEMIRVDNPFDTGGLTVSQFISLTMMALGGAYLWWIYRKLPPRDAVTVSQGARAVATA